MSKVSSERQQFPKNLPPQRVMSKIRFCGSKNLLDAHPVEGQFPTGIPSDDVSIVLELEESTLDTLDRVKNQIEIPFSANSVTNTPPPAAANASP